MVVGIQWPNSMKSCASLCDKLSSGPLDRVATIHLQAFMGRCGKLPWKLGNKCIVLSRKATAGSY
jgi:hypothetical protein